eukprot:TRINITY_DN498_c0_g1_i18.p1 TRINITY_DN498_c0_g1~~TRINITY_DN498_c0_g1_i18.p1  ORF type:complete len:100 (-),score=2.25 TRINITY_DN498_c0_g1_i18:537-836(-)
MKQWLYEVFKVAEVTRPSKTKASMYKLLGPDGKLLDRWFIRQDLLKIDRGRVHQSKGSNEYRFPSSCLGESEKTRSCQELTEINRSEPKGYHQDRCCYG